MVIVCGFALAAIGLSQTFQLPFLATVFNFCPANSTMIFWPSVAVPPPNGHTRFALEDGVVMEEGVDLQICAGERSRNPSEPYYQQPNTCIFLHDDVYGRGLTMFNFQKMFKRILGNNLADIIKQSCRRIGW
jgi:hypothetical protein